MTEPVQEDVHALLGAYALDALDDDERAAFERHLSGCADCRTEEPGMRAAAARLGATAYVTPPAQLKASVLAEVRRTRQLPPQLVVRSMQDARRRTMGTRLLASAAALLLVVATGLGVMLAVEQRESDRHREQIIALLTSADQATVDVPGGGQVVLHTRDDQALVEMRDVPPPPAGRTYELWVVPDEGLPVPAGLMPDGEGRAYLEDISGAQALAVTLEPAGGSDQPTTEPFLTVPV